MASHALQKSLKRIADIAERDGRYRVEAYLFVHQTLAYAELQRGSRRRANTPPSDQEPLTPETHFSPQQLCEAIRQYAQELFGMMAQVVLNSWGVRSTSDFGEIVFQLIEIGEMTKTETDHRTDFDDVFDFDRVFRHQYQFASMDDE